LTAQASDEAGAVKRYLPRVVATALFMEQLDSTIVNTFEWFSRDPE